MTASIYKNIGLTLICAFGVTIYACNNSTTTGSTSSTSDSASATATTAGPDTTNRMKQAEGAVTQTVNDAEASMKEAMARNPDSTFVATVAGANQEEITVLQAGIDKGTDKALIAHAKMMMKDHQGLAKKLAAYAAGKNYTIPTDDNGKGAQDLDGMSSKTGSDWDKAWVNFMYNAHEKTIGFFEGAKNQVKDPAVLAIINGTLPTLHAHLDMMKSLLDKMQ